MADIKKLIQRNRFSLEIVGIVAMSEFVVVQVLSHLAPQISGLHAGFVDTISLLLVSAPLIIWRSRAVHGRETQNLSEAVQSSSHSILMLDLAQRIRWVNEGFTRMTGYTLDEAMGQTPEKLLGSDRTAPGARKLLRDAVDAVQACRVQMCDRHKDGRLIWVDIDLRPDFDKGGRLVGFMEICTDITELTLAKSSLQASLREADAFRQTVDMHAIVSVADRSGRMTQVNDAFCAISGYSREQLLSRNHRILNSGTHTPQFWAAMWNAIAIGKPWRGEICNRNCQGQLYWVDSMIAPFLDADGQVEKYVSIRMDITERKTQELLLSDLQERVRLATESAGIGIWSFNPHTGAQSWDAQQYRLFGLSAEAHSAVPIYDLWSKHLHPQDVEEAEAGFRRSLVGGAQFVHQFRITRPDGAVRYIKALGSPRLDAEGRVAYIVGTNQDVTDAVLLTESMQEARLRAEEASQVKSRFLANMSHELRTPMNAVLGLLQLLESTVVDARQHTYVTQAEWASRLMMRMIDNVMDHSKLESEGMALSLMPFAVDEWLDKLAAIPSDYVQEKDINVMFEVPLALPAHLVGDDKRLQQVLVCLLDNAIKFTAKGEVVCQIVLVRQSAADCRLTFRVRDTGIGIAPEFLNTVFADFMQVQSGSTRAYGGLGLGLRVAQRLVGLMGGTIEVQSTPGEGSCFSFTVDLALPESLPAYLQPEVLPPKTLEAFLAPVRTPRLPDLRVLVVEDNPINQRVMKEILVAEGASVCLADNGQQGVEAIRASLAQQGFDVVLMDIQMPVMDGYQAAREIRHGLLLQHLPIIAVSANVAAGDRVKSLAAGMNLHIGKPFVRDELVAEIRRLTTLAPAENVPTLLDTQAVAMPAVEQSPSTAESVLQVYWIQGRAQRSMPNGACLLQQGVVLHLLDSVDELCTRITNGVDQSALVLAEMATITSSPMRDLREMNGASMKPMALVVLADAMTEDDIQECIRAGVVDMVSIAYGLDNLGVIARKHINADGELRVDPNNKVIAIDGHCAMERIYATPPFFGSLLRTFLDELPLRTRLLHDDWRHDPGQVKHRSHALRGLAVTLGLNSLAQVAQQAEALVPHQGQPLDPALLLQLDGEMQSARFQILRWLGLHQTSDSASP